MRGTAKGIWISVHRYVGLAVGVWLFAVGATGAILANYRELDAFLHPEFFSAANSPRHPDLDAMVANVRAAYPDRLVLFLDRYFLNTNETYPFILSAPLPVTPDGLDLTSIGNFEAAASLEVFVDPATANIVGARPYWTWIKIMRGFHRELFVPGTGRRFLGVLAVITFITCVAGGVLWWRDARGRMKRALSFRRSSSAPRILRDTHTVLGAYALIVIGWLSLTAALICYETPLRDLSNWVMNAERPRPVPVAPSTNFASLNLARDKAIAEYPNSDVVLIRMTKTPDGRLVFRLYPDDEPTSIYTRQVYINAGTADVVGYFDPDRQPWTDSLFGVWLIWFHNGGMFGLPFNFLNVAAGLILASLFPTGIYIWWRKRASRVASHGGAGPSAGRFS